MEKMLLMKDGRRIPVTGETGRYYITREAQYRKNNPLIASVQCAEKDALHGNADKVREKKKKRS